MSVSAKLYCKKSRVKPDGTAPIYIVLTFMIYLNDNYEGGETTFRGLKIVPKQGMALIFLHNLYHEGSQVTKGVKYVLRTDVMYRKRDEEWE